MLTRTRTQRPLQHAIANLIGAIAHRDSQQAKLAALIQEKFATNRKKGDLQITITLEEYNKTFEP